MKKVDVYWPLLSSLLSLAILNLILDRGNPQSEYFILFHFISFYIFTLIFHFIRQWIEVV